MVRALFRNMMHSLGQKIHMVAPDFFEYREALAESLKIKGYEVEISGTRSDESFFNRLIYRSSYLQFLMRPWLASQQIKLYRRMVASGTNIALFISPEVLASELVESLASQTQIVKVLYLWDSVNNKPNLNFNALKGWKIITFDPRDAEKHHMDYLPLFYEPQFDAVDVINRCFDVSFIGTIHSNRIQFLAQLKKIAISNGLKVFIWPYYGNILYLTRAAILWPFSLSKVGFKIKALTKEECAQILKQSRVALDLAHPRQTGFTSRTSEALAAGCAVLTTNKAANSEYSLSNRIHLFEILTADVVKQALEDVEAESESVHQCLDLESFTVRLLNLING